MRYQPESNMQSLVRQYWIQLLTIGLCSCSSAMSRDISLRSDYGDAGGEFSLFYTNCEKLTVVSFDIRVALYNVRANGYKDFLSVGEDMLPVVFMVSPPCLLIVLFQHPFPAVQRIKHPAASLQLCNHSCMAGAKGCAPIGVRLVVRHSCRWSSSAVLVGEAMWSLSGRAQSVCHSPVSGCPCPACR